MSVNQSYFKKRFFCGLVVVLLIVQISCISSYFPQMNGTTPVFEKGSSSMAEESSVEFDEIFRQNDSQFYSAFIAKYDDYLFINGLDDELHVFNLSSLSTPVYWKTHTIELTGTNVRVIDLEVKDRLLFIAMQDDSARIYNITESIDLVFLSEYTDYSGSENIEIKNDLMFVIHPSYFTNNDIHIVNISDPVNPTTVAVIDDDLYCLFFTGFFISNNSLIARGVVEEEPYDPFFIFNISNPSQPELLGSYEEMYYFDATLADANNNITCLPVVSTNTTRTGLHVFDISNKSNPLFLKRYYHNETDGLGLAPNQIIIRNDTAFIADYQQGLQVVDVSNGSDLQLLSTSTVREPLNMLLIDDLLFVCTTTIVKIYNVSNSLPVELGYIGFGGKAQYAHIHQHYGYIAHESGGWYVINLSMNPFILYQYLSPEEPVNKIWANEELVLCAFRTGYLGVFNNTDKSNPTLLTKLYTGTAESCNNFFVRDGYVYWTTDSYFIIINVLDPSSPLIDSTLALNSEPSYGGLFVTFAYAYLCVREKFHIIDISEPTGPTIIANYTSPGAFYFDITVIDTVVYLCEAYGEIEIIDVSNPMMPTKIGFFGSQKTLAYIQTQYSEEEDYLYTSGISEVEVFDCASSTTPAKIGNVSDLSFLPHFAVFGNYLLSARSWQGFVVYKTNITLVPKISPTNPFNFSNLAIILISTFFFLGVFVYQRHTSRRKY